MQKLDGLFELPLAQSGAPGDEISRRSIGVQAQYVLRELEGVVALAGEQAGIGEIKQCIRMGRLERDRLLKGIDRFGRLASFVATLAGVHPAGELLAARGRLPPQPKGEKQRRENDGEHGHEIQRDSALGTVRLNGVHGGEGNAGIGVRKANDAR